ncbi:hypothetical protein [Leptospira sp. GIMC2001]|uniref:hypothetical protein n=1 Tax=Leptospira sp. GIMC2001 TaxID=1513297 RepID=UPI00234BDDEF|nr:hypothetical protein [Leptospira sp. GIMC2001]WCL47902.1 hypothetical protein O4O04_11265 [Leptospira sp. GIMC2001]
MEAFSQSDSKTFKPFPHNDPYGLDNMYISDISADEIWDFSSFSKPDILSFSFFALRTLVHNKLFNKVIGLKIPSQEFRRAMGKKNWDLTNLPNEWRGYFPQLLSNSNKDSIEDKLQTSLSVLGLDDDVSVIDGFDWKDGNQLAGCGIIQKTENEIFPKILDKLISIGNGKIYLRTTRQSFLYLPKIGTDSKTGLFVQDKHSFNFPEFYYYWITLVG